jgi:beta-N-acetylhexosaminidase
MTGHLAFPGLTGANTPATLSPEIVLGLLRADLGFDGMVVTDALVMGAVAELHGPGEAAALALEAGADVLLMPADVAAAVEGVAAAVASGRMAEERIDRSLERVAALLSWLDTSASPSDHGACGDALAKVVAARAVTLLENDGLLPLHATTDLRDVVTPIACVDDERPPDLAPLRERLGEIVPGTELLVLSEATAADVIREIAARPAGAGLSILFVYDEPTAWKGRPGPSARLIDAVGRVIESSARAIVVGFAAPQLASRLRGAGAFLCCYDASAHMQVAALDVLFGEATAQGRLPMAVPGFFPLRHGHTRG